MNTVVSHKATMMTMITILYHTHTHTYILHFKGFSAVWLNVCDWRWVLHLNALLQMSHLIDLSPLCLRLYVEHASIFENLLSEIELLMVLPVCSMMCTKLPTIPETFSTIQFNTLTALGMRRWTLLLLLYFTKDCFNTLQVCSFSLST